MNERNQAPYGYGGASQTASAEYDAGLRAYMLRIYNYMASGLLLSGIVGVAGFQYLGFETLLGLKGITTFVTLGIILATWFTGHKWSAGATKVAYWLFSACFGVTLAVYLQALGAELVLRTFFVTAGAFGGLSLFGYTTKKDLSGAASFAMMGLIGIIIAMVVNIFIGSSMMHFLISCAGVLIFSIFIAWDNQRLRQQYYELAGTGQLEKAAVWGAFCLYLDFVNLFQFLLSLFAGGDD